MNIPKDVIYILDLLNRNGYEAYIVGGCVRDSFMNKVPHDWDITTSATPEQIKLLFPKTYDTGIRHGTVTVMRHGQNYEITTYRVDGKYEDHRRPSEVFYTKNLIEDLARRDFTINSIAYHPLEGFVDPFSGREDIQNQLIKGVGNAEERFNEDALRMLRAVRFSAQLDFDIEPATKNALQAMAPLIGKVSRERIRDELIKCVMAHRVIRLDILEELDILRYILPMKNSIRDILPYLDKSVKEKNICIALLLMHIPVNDCVMAMKRLAFDNFTCKRVHTLLTYQKQKISNAVEMKSMISNIGLDAFEDLLRFQNVFDPCYVSWMRQMVDNIKNDCIFMKDLAISGDDLMDAGIPKGPLIGEMLERSLIYVHQYPEKNHRNHLIRMIKDNYQ